MSTYLKINIAIIVIPLLLSFDKKVHFYRKWKFAMPAIAIPGLLFIIWDVWFTKTGVWSFNPAHLLGINLFGLPIEEYLFFITVPYASLFTYETIKTYWPGLNPVGIGKSVLAIVAVALIATAAVNIELIYTFVTFISTAVCIVLIVFLFKAKFTGRFVLSFMLIIFPFIFFNGILTGSFLDEPVVQYNNTEILGIRMWTIPVEDTFYGMLLILLNVFFFELFRKEV